MSWLFVVMFVTSSYFNGEVVLCDGDLNLACRFLMQIFFGVESFGEGAFLADAQAYPPYGWFKLKIQNSGASSAPSRFRVRSI